LGRTTATRGFAAAVMVATLFGALAPSATATDIEDLRTRAQALGSKVSDLEGSLQDLNSKRSELSTEIDRLSADLGILESHLGDAEDAYTDAMSEYVGRAVEAYKSGPASDLALLLSAQTLDQLHAYSELSAHTARKDARALEELLETKTVNEELQASIDERKQRLLVRHEQVDVLATNIETTLGARRAVLRELTDEIADLEAQARAAAAEAGDPDQALLDLLQPSGPAPEIPDGFASTGVGFEGVASWYGPGFEGNPTANGDIFDPDLFTAASKELPLGTWLFVTHNGRGVVVLVNDRGPYIDGRILDLSQAAAEAIGITGLGWIEAEILIKT
jgi:peptidoglycan hydrolase CwlO-like protein